MALQGAGALAGDAEQLGDLGDPDELGERPLSEAPVVLVEGEDLGRAHVIAPGRLTIIEALATTGHPLAELPITEAERRELVRRTVERLDLDLDEG